MQARGSVGALSRDGQAPGCDRQVGSHGIRPAAAADQMYSRNNSLLGPGMTTEDTSRPFSRTS